MRWGMSHPCETCRAAFAPFGLTDELGKIRWYCKACVPRSFWKYARKT